MPTLIQISRDLIELEEQLEDLVDNPDAQNEAIAQYLESFTDTISQRDQKLDNYAALIQELQARADARKAEAQRLQKRSQIDENKVKSLKTNLQRFFQAHELKTVETDRYRLTLAKNGGKLPMIIDNYDLAEIPDHLTVTTKELNREAVRKLLEAGEAFNFARLGNRSYSIRIN
jgi:chromosome segregation ATPase